MCGDISLWFWFAFPWWLVMLSIFSYAYWPLIYHLCCCSYSVTNPCPTLCDPMDCSMPGSPVLHHLLSSTIWVCSNSYPLNQWWCLTISSSAALFSSCLLSFPTSGSFPMSRLFELGGQSIGASASASVLPMNIQDWFPLGWTGWISLQSRELSRVQSKLGGCKNIRIH